MCTNLYKNATSAKLRTSVKAVLCLRRRDQPNKIPLSSLAQSNSKNQGKISTKKVPKQTILTYNYTIFKIDNFKVKILGKPNTEFDEVPNMNIFYKYALIHQGKTGWIHV